MPTPRRQDNGKTKTERTAAGSVVNRTAFDHKRQGAPSGALTSEPCGEIPIAPLGPVLAHWGLDEGDFPELRQVWEEKFGELRKPDVKTTDAFLRHYLGDPNFGRERGDLSVRHAPEDDIYTMDAWESLGPGESVPDGHVVRATIFTRNGGGNRECWHDEDSGEGCAGCVMDTLSQHPRYSHDLDDSFDPTYATIFFTIDEAMLPDALESLSSEFVARQRVHLESQYNRYASGNEPFWNLLGDADEMTALQKLRYGLRPRLSGKPKDERRL